MVDKLPQVADIPFVDRFTGFDLDGMDDTPGFENTVDLPAAVPRAVKPIFLG